MQIDLPGVGDDGTLTVAGPDIRFTFQHNGTAFVRMRVSWDIDKQPVVHPLPSGGPGQPLPRKLEPGRYLVSVRVHATDLPGLPSATIDSQLSINGQLVLVASGNVPANPGAVVNGGLFFLIVT